MPNKASDTFTLKNSNGVEVSFTAHGGRLVSLKVPSAKGDIDDVLVGYDTVGESLKGDLYYGALCGRYANRIVKGHLILDGQELQLDVNNGPNHLHGGNDGFNQRIWDVEETQKEGCTSAFRLSLISPDGDQKYPGECKVTVIYSLNDSNEFKIEYEAETTKPTVINLTSHPYFNLSGDLNNKVTNHLLTLNAEQFTPIDPEVETCNGEIADVKGTPMDFTNEKPISEAVTSSFEQIKMVDGLDHNFVVKNGGKDVIKAAVVKDPVSGRSLEVYTDQPGLQVYTGNHFDGSEKGKGGAPIDKYCGVALETQIFPNSPNHDNYPNAVLRPGEKYKHTCIYKFGF
ncbi:aldose epimerase family protein [Marinilabilia rubra]|uniref:Aldose 1-epimerase n=1 Tax=Marinilabilia rubra TaxID=2162893 RepID=A0A2U2BAW0_9BACT|nr:aldose epimerase family protein [Marinilabilia rubra]PWE00200.1 galactose-1-epimerase [Marinilabilia rubra]